jgi:hypothetical protein
VARNEPEFIVKSVRIGACLVCGELHECAPARAALLDCPFEHAMAKPCIAIAFINPDGLDLTAPGAFARDTGNECDLKRSNHVITITCNGEILITISLYRLEHCQVFTGKWQTGIFAQAPEFIIGKKCDNGWQVFDDGMAEYYVRAGHALIPIN